MIYRFGRYSIDGEQRELRRDDKALDVQPKVLDLILYLIRERERAVSRQELLDALWGDAAVIEGVLTTAIHGARAVLEDSASRHWAIKTVARHGYRFVAQVEVEDRSAPSPQQTPRPGVPWKDDVLVGRRKDLARIDAAFAAAAGGRGRILVVTGESGIGKTRLIEALVKQAESWGAQALPAWCYDREGSPPYWPWAQLLRTAVFEGDPNQAWRDMGAGASDLATIVPELRELPRDLPKAPRLPSGPARFRLFESVATFLTNSSRHRPLLILIDDLHSADHASLRLLAFLARELSHARVLSVVAIREGENKCDAVLEETLAELARHSPGDRIHLAGLDASETRQLIEHLTDCPPSPSLAEAIAERTEGNPFFIKEMVSLLQTQGYSDEAFETADWAFTVPPGVRDVLLSRLHRRSESCQQVLAVAAVLGREFRYEQLERMNVLPSAELAAVIDEAQLTGFLHEHPTLPGYCRFTHRLTQEALYAEWGSSERSFWHRRAGEALEALASAKAKIPSAELAHHFLCAAANGEVAKAVDYTVRAAEEATQVFAHDEAAKYYERALEALDLQHAPDQTRRCDILLALGMAQLDSRRSDPKARDSLLQAAHLARELGQADKLAKAAVALATIAHERGPGDTAVIELLERALEELGTGSDVLKARVMADLAIQRHRGGTLEEDVSLSEEALTLARKAADAESLGEALHLRCGLLSGPDHVRERLSQAGRLLELACEIDNAELRLYGHMWRMLSMLELGEIEAADREVEAYDRLAGEARSWTARWYALTLQAARALAEGRLDTAENLILKAFAQGSLDPTPFTLYNYGMQLLWLRREQGRLDEVTPGPRPDFRETRYPVLAAFRSTKALLAVERGAVDKARRELENLVADDLAILPRDFSYLYSLAVLTEICTSAGDPECAAVLYHGLRPFADRNVILLMGTACLGSAARYLGRLAAMMEDWETAEAHFADALERNGRLRARLWSAHTQLDWARMLLTRDGGRASTHSSELLHTCLATAEELGLTYLRDKALLLSRSATQGKSALDLSA